MHKTGPVILLLWVFCAAAVWVYASKPGTQDDPDPAALTLKPRVCIVTAWVDRTFVDEDCDGMRDAGERFVPAPHSICPEGISPSDYCEQQARKSCLWSQWDAMAINLSRNTDGGIDLACASVCRLGGTTINSCTMLPPEPEPEADCPGDGCPVCFPCPQED